MNTQNEGTELTCDDVELLFKFQDISAETYRVLENVIKNYPQNGLRMAVAEAYFMGTVDGKRAERRRNKTQISHIRI